jgi:hypothetical protein
VEEREQDKLSQKVKCVSSRCAALKVLALRPAFCKLTLDVVIKYVDAPQ